MLEKLLLTEVGQTCQDRGLSPVGSVAECTRMTDFVQTNYPKYEFNGEETNSKYPKGCYVYLWVIKPTGYFNHHWSGSGDLEARAICTMAEGMKQAIISLSNISLNLNI